MLLSWEVTTHLFDNMLSICGFEKEPYMALGHESTKKKEQFPVLDKDCVCMVLTRNLNNLELGFSKICGWTVECNFSRLKVFLWLDFV